MQMRFVTQRIKRAPLREEQLIPDELAHTIDQKTVLANRILAADVGIADGHRGEQGQGTQLLLRPRYCSKCKTWTVKHKVAH